LRSAGCKITRLDYETLLLLEIACQACFSGDFSDLRIGNQPRDYSHHVEGFVPAGAAFLAVTADFP
jgi:hypothetical protein